MTNRCAVRTQSLSRKYGSFIAVDDLNLAVPAGSIFGFLGPNGAGKTTTIRMLLGLIRPNAGSVEINGRDLAADRKDALASVGAIVETPTLYGNLTGRENLKSAALLIDCPDNDIDRVLEIVSLVRVADKRVKEYSLGMRQRLALARALLGSPKLLILDEPTNGLDPSGIADMRTLIRRLPADFGATVLLSSHILVEVEQIADHCALINHGKTLFQGRLDDLIAEAKATLAIQSADAQRTISFLQSKGVAAEEKNGLVEAPCAFDRRECAALLTAIVTDGQEISYFELKRPSLENLFLQMTARGETNPS